MQYLFSVPLLISLVFVTSAFTASASAPAPNRVNNTSLFIGEEVCKWARMRTPAGHAAYEGGVDVHGKPVAPASIADERERMIAERLLRKISIEITSDLAVQLGMPEKLIQQRLTVGTIEVDENDQLTINGEPLVKPDASAWAEACAQAKLR